MASITTRKLLSTITALCFVALFSVIGVKLLTGSKAATTDPYVHVVGTKILNASGQQIYFSGIDVSEMEPGPPESACPNKPNWTDITDQEIDEIMGPTSSSSTSDGGMNTIRIAVSWADLEPTAPTLNSDGSLHHSWNPKYIDALNQTINYIHSHYPSAMVILDMHKDYLSPAFSEPGHCDGFGFPTWMYPNNNPGPASDPTKNNLPGAVSVGTANSDFWKDQNVPLNNGQSIPELPWQGYQAAWQELAQLYAGNPTVVGADIYNEPTNTLNSSNQNDLATFYTTIGNAIRSKNPNIILIYEGNAYSNFTDGGSGNFNDLLKNGPPTFNTTPYDYQDAIYSWHYYPKSNDADKDTALSYHVKEAYDWKVPLWIGENDAWGLMYLTDPSSSQISDFNSMLAYFQDLKTNGSYPDGYADFPISWTFWAYSYGGYQLLVPKSKPPQIKPFLLSGIEKYEYSPSTPPPPTPTVTITAPTAGEVLSGTETVSATASVSSGSISKITLSEVNSSGTSTTLTSCSSVSSCSYSWNTNNVSNGNYTINASASASGGGSATAIPVKVSVANAPTCTPPIISTPSGLASPTGDQTTSSITLTWGASTDCKNLAITYHVFRAESGNWKQVGSPTATSYTDTGLTPGTTYDYEVDATDTGGNTSAMSSTASATTQRICTSAPATPTGLDATDIEATTATLSWDAVSNPSLPACFIAKYSVSIENVATGAITTLSTPSSNSPSSPPSTSLTDSSLTPDTKYSFSVVAVTNDSTPSNPSNLYPFTTGKPVCSDLGPTTPSGLSFPIVGTTGVTLSWNESTDSCSGISGYNVFREQQGSSSFTQVNAKLVPQPGSGTTVSFGDSGLSPATAYNYYVVAVSGENKTAQSTTAAVTTLDSGPKTPYDFKAKASTNQIALSWQDSDPGFPASKLHYSVYRNPTNPPTGTPTYTTQQGVASQTDTGLAPNTPYFYAVTATNLSGQTSAAYITPNPITTTKLCPNPPGTPSGLAASAVTATSATLGWNAVSNPSSSCKVVQYVLTRKDNATGSVTNLPVPPGDPTQLPLTPPPATSYDDSGLTPNTSYSYTVVAVTNDGTPSATASAPVTFTTGTPTCTDNGPTAPTLSGVAANNDQVNLSWSASSDSCSNISGYEVWREDPGSTSFQELTTSSTLVSGLTYGDGTVSPATTYNYYVVAVSGESKTAQSNTVPVTTPTNPVNPNNGGNSGTGSNGSNSPLDSNPLLIGTTSVGSGSEAGGSVSQNPTSTSPGLSPLPSNPSKAKLTTKKLSSSPVAAVLYSLAGVALLAGCMVLIVFRRHHRYRPAATTPYDPDIFQPQVIHPEITPTVPPDPAQVIHPDNDPNQTNENNKEN